MVKFIIQTFSNTNAVPGWDLQAAHTVAVTTALMMRKAFAHKTKKKRLLHGTQVL